MSPDELATLRAKLEARREELIALGNVELEKKTSASGERPDEDADPLTEMNQVIASRRNAERTRELRGIAQALHRMANNPGDFGYCDECDDPIPPKRLELMPWAKFCVTCQSARDPTRGGARKHLTDFK